MNSGVRSHVCRLLFVLAVAAAAAPALAQVPLPMEEQIRMFNSLPPAEQQALIRELQQQLPPAQRRAVLELLQPNETPDQQGDGVAVEEDGESFGLDFGQQLEEPEIVRFAAGDTVVVQLVRREDDPGVVTDLPEDLASFEQRLARGNPYRLDSTGHLLLPGIPPIALAGLTVEEATVRVEVEPGLRIFEPTLTRLPLAPVGFNALKPFGYDIFNNAPSTFAPATDIPVPADYIFGPGDTVYIQLFGAQNDEYFLTVSREGVINFPGIGPQSVSGLTFQALRDAVNQRVTERMIGVRASVTLGELRSIRVFVLGEVMKPGSYTVSGLATMANALLASGGVTLIGSLRNVALRRNGDTVTTLDLYDLMLRGDTSADTRLQPGDVIFVPPVGQTVAVDGAVRRPAIYELRSERSVSEVIALAGGMNANANRAGVKLERIVPGRGTTARDVDLTTSTAGSETVRDGDLVRVLPNLEQLESSVRLDGNVFQPGLYEWTPGMRLSDLLPSPSLVRPLSDLNYVLIKREPQPNVRVEAISADLEPIWQRRSGAPDVELQQRDVVYVFNIDVGRAAHNVSRSSMPLPRTLRPMLRSRS